jgi:hypothetical protein
MKFAEISQCSVQEKKFTGIGTDPQEAHENPASPNYRAGLWLYSSMGRLFFVAGPYS